MTRLLQSLKKSLKELDSQACISEVAVVFISHPYFSKSDLTARGKNHTFFSVISGVHGGKDSGRTEHSFLQ
jgi:hypothetical protein